MNFSLKFPVLHTRPSDLRAYSINKLIYKNSLTFVLTYISNLSNDLNSLLK